MKQVVSYEPLLESEDYELGIVGRSEPMQQVFKLIGQVAASDATALITGESGTGKELVARAIYHHSNRSATAVSRRQLRRHSRAACWKANCSATNAARSPARPCQRIGKFEQCNHGTIFLDEIGDMTPATQTKILRVLQSGTFERVGGNQPIQVDVRVIAATNKPLEAAVAAQTIPRGFVLPAQRRAHPHPAVARPARGHSAAGELFSAKNLRANSSAPPKSIAASVIKTLEKYHWPGNVRELENAIRRAHVMAKSDAILLGDLPPEISGQTGSGAPCRRRSPASPATPPRPMPPRLRGNCFNGPGAIRN